MRFSSVLVWLSMIVCVALLGGCASIPLSTAMRLSSLDEKTLVQLVPADIRVRLSVPRGNELDVEHARLKLELQPNGAAPVTADMRLRLLGSSGEPRSVGMFRAAVPVTTYELALAPEGAGRLRELQRDLMAMKSSGLKYSFSVDAPFSTLPPDTQEVRFWVDLKLRAAEAYMPLIDGATIRFTSK